MSRKPTKLFSALILSLIMTLCCNPVFACSWAFFKLPLPKAPGEKTGWTTAAIVARTMDWGYMDEAVIKGVKAGAVLRTAEDELDNPLTYTAKYASIQIFSFGKNMVSDALNEMGLQGSLLYLEGSKLPDYREGAHGVDPFLFIAYAVSVFDSVDEVVQCVREGRLNFLHVANAMKEGSQPSAHLPFHFAFSDVTGGRAIIEFIDGKAKIYNDLEDSALTNEPVYSVHKALEKSDYQPNGSISTIDRRARAKRYLKEMYASGLVTDTPGALMAMRGLVASVFAGLEEIDRSETETESEKMRDFVYPTQWWTLTDLQSGTYYLTRLDSWCAEVYTFAMVANMPENQGVLVPAARSHPKIP
ncbi:linear amide C-N hydrolase [Desulfovibrio sp. OttesenSCG-928-G15]|nr:linear amide C-N hydrolase [Desulfovibrio sp. OttesenSCG-928-G15]